MSRAKGCAQPCKYEHGRQEGADRAVKDDEQEDKEVV